MRVQCVISCGGLFLARIRELKLPNTPVIAIIDDDQLVREALTSLVRSMGYAAVAFEYAEDFLKSKRRRSVSCVIAGVQMPGMSDNSDHGLS
jgi:FixJ family two-component response regulator